MYQERRTKMDIRKMREEVIAVLKRDGIPYEIWRPLI